MKSCAFAYFMPALCAHAYNSPVLSFNIPIMMYMPCTHLIANKSFNDRRCMQIANITTHSNACMCLLRLEYLLTLLVVNYKRFIAMVST